MTTKIRKFIELDLGIAPTTQRVFITATGIAKEKGDQYISDIHLLIALLTHTDSLAGNILVELGLNPKQLLILVTRIFDEAFPNTTTPNTKKGDA